MQLKEFLDHPDIQLPVTRGTDDFQAFVNNLLDKYLGLLAQLDVSGPVGDEIKSNRLKVEAFCSAAKEVVREAYAGQPADAYKRFSEGIKEIETYLQRQALRDLEPNALRLMYRVRRSTTPGLTREDLFHIPFETRHRVATQRYSIPGLPCLYLAGSIYTCWAEMGRPPFHELQTAAFWLAPEKKVSVINFSVRPAKLTLYVNPEGSFQDDPEIHGLLVNHVLLWPLMALCSIGVRHRDSPFKPEYILPQVLLQWVTKEHHFDGICYFSMHVPAITPKRPLSPCNLVFPATDIQPVGRCPKLRDRFRMTEPLGWELLTAIHAGEGVPGAAVPMYEFEFIPGRKEWYYKTDFGEVETKLNKIALDLITKNNTGDLAAGIVKA